MNILITGAAGYVGSVITEEVIKVGHTVVALDDLSAGYEEAVSRDAEFILGNFGDIDILNSIFSSHSIDAVMHIGAFTIVGESVSNPSKYFRNNVVNSLNLLDSLIEHKINKLIFSSSCAVYGNPEKTPITEDTPKNPINPYGETKLMFERMLHWYGQAYGLSSVSLRYFNAAGATDRCGENHNPETHLIPVILQAARDGKPFSVFGTDYPTPDGTCVRDYVHVSDIASAHLLSLEYLNNNTGCFAFNLGSEKGYSVLEVLDAVNRLNGKIIKPGYAAKRPGDPPVLVGDSTAAQANLGWKPRYSDINKVVGDAQRWITF